jgi:DNA-binding MarR family transcriptional regulator
MQQDWRAGDPGADHITVDGVRGHPRFEDAKAALIDGLAGLYLDDWRLRGLVEYERGVTFMLIVSLDAARDPEDEGGGVPMQVLNDVLPTMGIAPGRRIADLAANLRRDGMLQSVPAPNDGRARLLRATPRAIAADCEWIRVFHQPLTLLRPEVDYRPALGHDRGYQRAFRLAGLRTLDIANEIMSANPPMDYFVQESVGFRVLMILMQSIRGSAENRSSSGFFSRAAQKGGMSRTHVKNVLTKAADLGYVAFSERPGDYVEVRPVMVEAFDRWTAESLSSIDRVRAYADIPA